MGITSWSKAGWSNFFILRFKRVVIFFNARIQNGGFFTLGFRRVVGFSSLDFHPRIQKDGWDFIIKKGTKQQPWKRNKATLSKQEREKTLNK
jgi:hypothetical protein